jgi:galactonate dehydratase
MGKLTRRMMLKIAGTFALPTLAKATQQSGSPFQRPRLKITDVRTAQVRVHGLHRHVRVCSEGLYGQGESTDAAVGTEALVGQFHRLLVGQDPLNVDALWERLRVSGIFAGAQGGQYVTALSGVEIALWDLAGKALGLPVYQLLGFRSQF